MTSRKTPRLLMYPNASRTKGVSKMTANPLLSSPKLNLLPPEVLPSGMQVFELQLAPHGTPLAPFKASYFTVEPNGMSPIDSHSVHEIWMVAQGCGELTYDGRTCIIEPRQNFYF